MPKFPFTNYHELNLDWILKKVNALFDASEENARTISTYNSRLTSAEHTATSAETAASSAQQLADAAAATAGNALSVAGTADAKADSALTASTDARNAASNSLTIAQEAQQTAGAAVATANDAAATASGLESLANTANQNATAAVETAGTAVTTANNAATAANTADQKAVAAQQTANGAQSAAATNAGNISTLQTDVSDLNRQISEFDDNLYDVNKTIKRYNYFNGNTHSGIHSQTDGASYGTVIENINYFYTDLIPIDDFTTIYTITNFFGDYTEYITFFNSSELVIGKAEGRNLFITNIPSNTKYFIVCVNIAVKDTLIVSPILPDKYYSYDDVIINNIIKPSFKYKRLDRGFINGYITAGVGSKVYPLTKSSNLICSYPVSLSGVESVSFFNISTKGFTVVYINNRGNVIGTESLTNNGTATLNIPTGAIGFLYYAGVTTEDKFCFAEGSTPPTAIYQFNDININGLESGNSSTPLYEKKILFIGDSITAGTYFNGGWVTLISQNFGCSCTNAGHDGWSVGIIPDRTDNLLSVIPTLGNDYDIVALSGGYNDFTSYPRAKVGSLTPYTTSAIDTSTFCGSLESYIRTAKSKWMGKKICYVLTMKKEFTDTAVTERQQQYWELIRNCCKKYAIPFIDLYYNSGFVGVQGETGGYTEEFYLNGDGTHPNAKGYEFLYTKIARFMMTL